MMDARKLLINLLYRATAQSSELPGWSHRETKNDPSRIITYVTYKLILSPKFKRQVIKSN